MSSRCQKCGLFLDQPIALIVTDHQQRPKGPDPAGKDYANWLEQRTVLEFCAGCYRELTQWMAA